MGMFNRIRDRLADEKAAWDAAGEALDRNDAARARRDTQPKTTPGTVVGDGGAGVVANIVVDSCD